MTLKDESATSIDGQSPELFHLEIDALTDARHRLSKFVIKTPLLQSKCDPEVFFKTENLQHTGSFKVRPAVNQVVHLTEMERNRGIVTSSSGNFAQGAAYAARCFNLSAKIVMMKSSNPFKVEGTKRLGGEVVFCDDNFEARQKMVNEIRERERRTEIHPYDRIPAIVGNATIGAEILEQFAAVEQVIVPVSGGGLIAGVASALKLLKPAVRVFGVQPEGSNATFLSFHKRQPVTIDRVSTIADGLVATKPGESTFPLIRRYVDDLFLVKEETLRRGVRSLLLDEKLVAEPSAAVALAAILEGHVPRGKTVCLLSGGNLNPEILVEILGNYRRRFF